MIARKEADMMRRIFAVVALTLWLTLSAAPANARSWLCFFDADSVELTPQCQLVLRQFVSSYPVSQRHPDGNNGLRAGSIPSGSVVRFEVAAHTDRNEAPGRRQALSERRAQAVLAFLMLSGVPQDRINTTAFGETRTLVPTAPRVAERQNRRVELVAR